MWRHREKVAVGKPGGEPSAEPQPCWTLTWDFRSLVWDGMFCRLDVLNACSTSQYFQITMGLLRCYSIVSICISSHFIFKTLTPQESREYHDEHLGAEEAVGMDRAWRARSYSDSWHHAQRPWQSTQFSSHLLIAWLTALQCTSFLFLPFPMFKLLRAIHISIAQGKGST